MLLWWSAVLSTVMLLATASEHDSFQAAAPVHTSSQGYLPTYKRNRRLLFTAPTSEESCEQIHQDGNKAPVRIGYEIVDFESVPDEKVAFVRDKIMAQAVHYWSSTLKVYQATQPLRVQRLGRSCYNLDGVRYCGSSVAPTCGYGGLVTIPDKYHKAVRTCSDQCVPAYTCQGSCVVGGRCQCNVDDWAAQGENYCCRVNPTNGCDCPHSNLTFHGSGTSGSVLCRRSCTDVPEGEGAIDEDLHIFVTIKQEAGCGQSTSLSAFATWCVKDQCDRPIFASINFCPSKVDVEGNVNEQVSTAVHELAHALVFSSSLFRYFRNADGSPMIPREVSDQDHFPNEVQWSCVNDVFKWPDTSGNRFYVDIAPTILNKFPERGFDNCQCPIGTNDMGAGCLVPPTSNTWRQPTCVVRITTPTVVAEARSHFNCNTLEGAELENQDTSSCTIIGSHWEQRVFNGEVMCAIMSSAVPAYMSRVTLALFQDSGWYDVDMSKADPLTPGVHWGYQQGCAFATQKCISDGVSLLDRAFCTDATKTKCSGDHKQEFQCSLVSWDFVPPIFDYFNSSATGIMPEMDYCPTYSTALVNRVCADPSVSIFMPYHNVNMMREVFSSSSRCFMSTLRADVNMDGTVYKARPESLFALERPICYEVNCAAGGASYTVMVADTTVNNGTLTLGTCTAAGQTLSIADLEGEVTCVAPAEMCQTFPSVHNSGSTTLTTTTMTTTTTATATTVSVTTKTATATSVTTGTSMTMTTTTTFATITLTQTTTETETTKTTTSMTTTTDTSTSTAHTTTITTYSIHDAFVDHCAQSQFGFSSMLVGFAATCMAVGIAWI